ncbi:MAG: class I SAM-dependent RNA methyltransferase [Dehalococcoidia bacterium]
MSRTRGSERAASPPRRGDTVRLSAGPLVFGGACLSRLEDGRVAMLAFAAPGETVEARIDRVHKDYVEASAVSITEASPARVAPRCPLFGECGGCQLQHLGYGAQTAAKADIVREQLRRIGGLPDSAVAETVGAAEPWGYRNHIRLSTGRKFGDVGFMRRGRRSLLKVEHCPIAAPWINELLPSLQGHGRGLHQVQLRHSAATGSYLVTPAIDGIPVESGQDAYRERLAGHEFRVGANAFFQVNAAQAEVMVRLVGESLPEQGELLVDAFAGVGTFAAIFAGRFERVIAMEESVPAAADARANTAGIPGVEIMTGKVEELLPELGAVPDAVLLDPPRPGCAPAVIAAICRFRPGTVVYVSCNPATFARDARLLVNGGYDLRIVTPIDMFPQTGHIECMARFEARAGE